MLKSLSLAILSAFATLGPATGNARQFDATDPAGYELRDVYHRDVVIIGGGSSGVYSAMRLRDHGKTVMVVEKRDTLGGHAEAWVDPVSRTPVDIGVVVFANTSTVTDYFARFNLSLVLPTTTATPNSTFVDFSTGNVVNFTEPDAAAFSAAVDTYLDHLNEFPALQGSFNMTYPVHPDLLLSFGDFVAKYNMSSLVPQVFRYNQGPAPLLNISMLYLFKYLNSGEISSLKQGFLSVDRYSVTELYRRAAGTLGIDVMFDSTVVEMDRSLPKEVRVAIRTPVGPKLVIAKTVLTTIPPILDNLVGYDLSAEERSLFSQFFANGYYTGVLNNTGLDPAAALVNHAPDRPYGIPDLPGIYAMHSTPLPGDRFVTNAFYGSPDVLPDDDVKADIVATIQRYQTANGMFVIEPNWLKFSSHAPFNLMVPNDKIADGFYEWLFALQGQRNTFYNGAAWHTQDSSALWEFTDYYVIPIMLASLSE
ncbi:Beta-cyclopiazonate dehydrogenase [Apiospora rasikravindrae]|uniref:Beta-cyclopiazonate dehydrogenase n=1 Tax=Apiospora rasikravindrae TaxID=990691 RepID=A0ABR1U7C6_9PEZI